MTEYLEQLLKTKSPTRVLIIVKQRHTQLWEEAWETPQKTISTVLKYLKFDALLSPDDQYGDSNCRFIAVERWDYLVFIVCDLFNTDYNHDDAHLDGKNELPVISVRISQGDRDRIIKTDKPREIKDVGSSIRKLHDSNGWEKRVPFKVDHAKGAVPSYENPRMIKECD